ncbi:hypothetical protein PILCRDRAFT_827938 [Piloderma croceum F 1598]|uniref:Uncharacterized protein n=1 Tax=Piloderma croceum (strain F 1598) TaxID=765440 RepID=A0A0C3ALG4_PILCF|nr:hypothetical protein PILCRDRAFT_827938 [Piloderma croceum F 1598]
MPPLSLSLCLGYLLCSLRTFPRTQIDALLLAISYTHSVIILPQRATIDHGLRAYRAHSVVLPTRKIIIFHLRTIFSNSNVDLLIGMPLYAPDFTEKMMYPNPDPPLGTLTALSNFVPLSACFLLQLTPMLLNVPITFFLCRCSKRYNQADSRRTCRKELAFSCPQVDISRDCRWPRLSPEMVLS